MYSNLGNADNGQTEYSEVDTWNLKLVTSSHETPRNNITNRACPEVGDNYGTSGDMYSHLGQADTAPVESDYSHVSGLSDYDHLGGV